jgi:hypothetical protein
MHYRWKKGQARTCNRIVKYLQEVGEAPFPLIKEYLNTHLKSGVTSSRLSNVLSKYPEFEKVGMTGYKGQPGIYSKSNYPITIWRLSALE